MPPALIVLNMTLNCSLTSLLINIMAIRKAIASGLYSAAAAVQRDQTKEKLQATVSGARVVLAEWIRPKPNR